VIRVLVTDDQPLMRAAFGFAVQSESDLVVVGEAADGAEAIDMARRLRPDVVLMDVRMPGVDGVEATRQLANDDEPPKILLLTTFDIDDYSIEALRAGASGFLLKDVDPQELAQAVRAVAQGEVLLAPSVTRRLVDAFAASTPAVPPARARVLEALTETECRVLALIGRGLTNEEIMAELSIADSTIRTHVRHIFEKLGLHDRVEAVVVAFDSGLVQPASR
jgi:DNA-binding NarL/FixJ family response regulator